MIDWKLILMKYINHVGECEGTDFINHGAKHLFTDEEWSALNQASEDTSQEKEWRCIFLKACLISTGIYLLTELIKASR